MKLISILTEKENIIEGTNCANCEYSQKSEAENIEKGDLNKQGGIDSKSKQDLALAEKADLITLPGKKEVDKKKHCNHPKVNQFVTQHMCCAYWNNTGTHRAYGKQEIGK